jgi:hypothetical protein
MQRAARVHDGMIGFGSDGYMSRSAHLETPSSPVGRRGS